MQDRGCLRRDRIREYLDNLDRQVSDLEALKVPDYRFFLERKHFERTKAIRFSLICAIQDVTRIALHISTALDLTRVRESESEAILALGDAGILEKEYVERIRSMPAFRNRLVHDYLPNEFDAQKLYEALERLGDFRTFAQQIVRWVEREDDR